MGGRRDKRGRGKKTKGEGEREKGGGEEKSGRENETPSAPPPPRFWFGLISVLRPFNTF